MLVINNTLYANLARAAQHMGKSRNYIEKRLNDEAFEDFSYACDHKSSDLISMNNLIGFTTKGRSSKPVIVDNEVYNTIEDASDHLSIGREALVARIENPEIPNYLYFKDKN